MNKARRPYKGENKRQKYEYQCSCCKKWYKRTEVEKDHIVPCGSLRCFDDLPGFVERMFVSVNDYRILCKPCHLTITKEAKNE